MEHMKKGMESIQNSLTEVKSTLRPTPEPVRIHDNENNFPRNH